MTKIMLAAILVAQLSTVVLADNEIHRAAETIPATRQPLRLEEVRVAAVSASAVHSPKQTVQNLINGSGLTEGSHDWNDEAATMWLTPSPG